jgi:hypothetical protein
MLTIKLALTRRETGKHTRVVLDVKESAIRCAR